MSEIVLKTANLCKEFGRVTAVDQISFEAESGQVIGLIGLNGAGKTTLLRILATALSPTRGSCEVFGHSLTRDYLKIRQKVGYLPDFFNLYSDLTLEECLKYFALAYGTQKSEVNQRVDDALAAVELSDRKSSFIRKLSRGMVQRLGLATLLVRSADLFLLDEPASGLDPRARIQLRNVLAALKSQGKTVIISSHILTEIAGFCSHIAIMDKGRLIRFGQVDEISREMNDGRCLTIEITSNLDAARQYLEQMDDINIIKCEEKVISVKLTGGDHDVVALNRQLVTNGHDVLSFYEQKADIEDLFMQLTAETTEKGGENEH